MIATVDFTLNHPDAVKPIQATDGAAAVDLVSASVGIEGQNLIVNTGLRTSFPPGYGLFVFSRSGYARKYGLSLANGVAVIDSDYRGDILLVFNQKSMTCSLPDAVMHLRAGQRVAQAILLPLPFVHWNQQESLDPTLRGEGGFGSTGA